MKFRSVDYNRIVKPGKPVRTGYLVSSSVIRYTQSRRSMHFIGRIPKEWLPAAEREFGDVLITRPLVGTGHVLGYVKAIDLA